MKRYLPWVLVGAWAIFLFVCSSIPGEKMPKAAIFGHDKLIHCGVYAVLAALVMFALRSWMPAITMVSAYGATDELHQLFTRGRDCDVFDWMADTTGAILGATLILLALRWYGGRHDVDPAELRR